MIFGKTGAQISKVSIFDGEVVILLKVQLNIRLNLSEIVDLRISDFFLKAKDILFDFDRVRKLHEPLFIERFIFNITYLFLPFLQNRFIWINLVKALLRNHLY